jgi:ABC-type amino acid transport substrate-binding protein
MQLRPPCFARHWAWVSGAAHADTLAKVRDSGRITLAYRESSVPFSYLDNGKPIGMTVDISNAWPKP